MTFMYPFINRTHNPLGGGHELLEDGSVKGCYGCTYCWASALKNRYKWAKYLGEYRWIEKEFNVRYKPDDFTFVCDMIDIGRLPAPLLITFFDWLKEQPGKILTVTKNPKIYAYLYNNGVEIPENVYLGATIESNKYYPEISKAPSQFDRLYWMNVLSQLKKIGERLFISIEPVMDFDFKEFETDIYRIRPWAVAIGYDNYSNGLPEPGLYKVNDLISEMEKYTTVYKKTLREPLSRAVEND